MTVIIGISGKKQSGKNTTANFLHGHILKLNEVIRDYEITDKGELKVNTTYLKDGEIKEDMGVLDLCRKDELYVRYADGAIWPYIKLYHFADALKEVCTAMFGLTYDQVYGNMKHTRTRLKWENMPGVITPEQAKKAGKEGPYDFEEFFKEIGVTVRPKAYMTSREVMQFVGTEIFRKIDDNIWINLLMEKIKADSPLIAIIADVRFANEALAVKEADGILINLTRVAEDDSHASETGLDDFTDFDLVVDNKDLSIKSSNDRVLEFLCQKGISQFLNKAE